MQDIRSKDEEVNSSVVKKTKATDEIKDLFLSAYKKIEEWIRPKKNQHVVLQFLFFILKLPVLLLMLLLSPILLVVLMLVFVIAL